MNVDFDLLLSHSGVLVRCKKKARTAKKFSARVTFRVLQKKSYVTTQ